MDIMAMLQGSLDVSEPDWTVLLAIADHLEETGDTDGASAYRRAYEVHGCIHLNEDGGPMIGVGGIATRLSRLIRHAAGVPRSATLKGVYYRSPAEAAHALASACSELVRHERADLVWREGYNQLPPEMAALRLVVVRNRDSEEMVSLALGVTVCSVQGEFLDVVNIAHYTLDDVGEGAAALAAGLPLGQWPGWPAVIEYIKTLGVA